MSRLTLGGRKAPNVPKTAAVRERALVMMLSAAAFVAALDAIIVFSLGPFLAIDLEAPVESVGFLGGAYSLAAACGGLLASPFMDRFDRRLALACCVAGFAISAIGAGLAGSFAALMATRAAAGLFAGPLWGILIAIVSDVVPLERRGAAISSVVGSYGMALVVGLPVGALLADTVGGWRLTFFLVGAIGGLVGAVTVLAIGPRREHLAHLKPWSWLGRYREMIALTSSPQAIIAFLLVGSASFAAFLISPNLAVFALHNASLDSAGLSLAYLLGGMLTLAAAPATGRLIDTFGGPRVSIVVAVIMTVLLVAAFVIPRQIAPPVLLFALVMAFQLVRSAVNQAWITRVPETTERGAFQSLVAVATNLSQALGAMSGALILTRSASGQLVGMDKVALLACLLTWTAPLLLFFLNRLLRHREPDISQLY